MAGGQEDRTGAKTRAQRLAQELRANLARRKAQARERSAPDASRPGDGSEAEPGFDSGLGDRKKD